MITTFRVQNYKALRDVTLELTPLHVLIGPNDSGKTSLLEALRAYSRIACGQGDAFGDRWDGRQLVWRQTESQVKFTAAVQMADRTVQHSTTVDFPGGRQYSPANNSPPNIQPPSWLRDAIGAAHYYRWVPTLLTLPVVFDFPTHSGMESSGFGLAMYLNDILTNAHEKFGELEQRFRDIFPAVQRIRLNRESGFVTGFPGSGQRIGLGIYFKQANGDLLVAAQASDGMMLVLAYLAILFSPQPPGLLLIEEPENGVHPRRLQEVLRILRELVSEQDRTQVVLTTHSPYVVDLFKPEEVTLCLKAADGAVTTHRLADSKSVREQMDIFQLGEIWTAEGDEALAAPAETQEAASP